MKTIWILTKTEKEDSTDPKTEILGAYAMKDTAYAKLEEQIKELPVAVNFEKDTMDHVIVSFDNTTVEYCLKEHKLTLPIDIKLGDKVKVQGIEMTCTSIQSGVENDIYYLVYFNVGELKEYKFRISSLLGMQCSVTL